MGNFSNLSILNRRGLLLAAMASFLPAVADEPRVRARGLGLAPGVFNPGALNAITDVPGVRVGHTTLIEGANVRTGVTAILPHGGNLFQEKVTGAVFVGNAFGKLAGSTQVQELGTIETPIVLTNTLSVGTAVEAVVRWTLAQTGNEKVGSVNALVGETNDGQLNDIRGQHVRGEHVLSAIAAAKEGPVKEGAVGAGTGTICFGWKGGIGTASRVLPQRYGGHRLGVLVQTNFGGVLTMGGAPVGKELKKYAYSPQGGDGSCMIVIATDAPASGHECQRLAARGVFGLARTGSSYSNGSGDFAICFSTSHGPSLSSEEMSPLFEAVLEAVEEAVYNSLLAATTMQGNGRTIEALPIGQVRQILKVHRLAP